MMSDMNAPILVYGATGHTARFVIDELLRRGLSPILGARTTIGLNNVGAEYAGLEKRAFSVDDPTAVRRAVDGAAAIINCAGPFIDTGAPLAEAAIETGAHYLDLSAEQNATQALYHQFDGPARDAGVAIVPAMGFYGGLADLLLSVLLEDGAQAENVDVAIGLTRWWPTVGTRATGARNTAARLIIQDAKLSEMPQPAPTGTWTYPGPLGTQPVVQLPFSEVITIERHLDVVNLRSVLNIGPLEDLRDAATPGPSSIDEHRRSEQEFVVDVVAQCGAQTRRISARGRDIYAISAPIIVEGALRLLDGRGRSSGAVAPGEVFDAADLLQSLEQGANAITVAR